MDIKGIFQLFMRWFGGESGSKKQKSFYWIIVLVLIGMAIMILSSFLNITEQVIPYDQQPSSKPTGSIIDKKTNPQTMEDYEKIYENQLTEVITDMLGIDEVTVKINLDSTEELVVKSNVSKTEQVTEEKDKQGGTRSIKDNKLDEQTVLYSLDSNEKPLVLKTLKPKVRGVVVVARGAENLKIKAMILEAVQRLLNVPPYNIGIFPKI